MTTPPEPAASVESNIPPPPADPPLPLAPVPDPAPAVEPLPDPAPEAVGPPQPTPIPDKRFLSMKISTVRKFAVALIAAIAIAVTQGLVQGTAAKWAAVILGFASAVGVYRLPNDKPAAAKTGEGG